MPTLNLGILAHVDAGKTTLTERLLYAAGVIDEIGSVDDGTTQTDTLELERRRGITIKSAVVSFVSGGVTVNLIDTPGHPDFIAEVERVLGVLDGAVLVISAVEGVQAQTRILMRTLQRLRIPTLLFVNKVDRRGAQYDAVLDAISDKLTSAIVPMGTVRDIGTRMAAFTPFGATDPVLADALADHDDAFLAAYIGGSSGLSYRHELARQTKRALVHPVFFGSAITGSGVDELTAGISELLPAEEGDPDGPVSGTVFKVERGPAGEKIAYVRLFSGSVRVRDRLQDHQKVTAIRVFDGGAAVQCQSFRAGQIAKLWGLGDVRIGDAIGMRGATASQHQFAPPTLETALVPRDPAAKGALHGALVQLAEQDPLINLRQDDVRQELFVSLYGEVQKQVIEETLAAEFGIAVEFRETTTVCIERPAASGSAVELIRKNPFLATVGLRIEPAAPGTGVEFRLEAELASIPLYVYKTVDEFRNAMSENVRTTLSQGLRGWQVTDCTVTMTQCDYLSPGTGSGDYRKLTPLVLMSALRRAGTVVCEPIHRFHLEAPADTLAASLRVLARMHALPKTPEMRRSSFTLEGDVPASLMHELQQQLRAPTRGEGVLELVFDRYEPVRGAAPTRPRTDNNPLNRKEYLLHVLRRL